MTLIDNRHFQLKSGKTLALPAGLKRLDVHDEVYVAYYECAEDRISIYCSDIQNGAIRWSISKDSHTTCTPSLDGLSLELESAIFKTEVPMREVVQIDGGFAIRAAESRKDGAIFKVDATGAINWISEPVYSSLVEGPTRATVRGRAGEAIETLDVATGNVIEFHQGR